MTATLCARSPLKVGARCDITRTSCSAIRVTVAAFKRTCATAFVPPPACAPMSGYASRAGTVVSACGPIPPRRERATCQEARHGFGSPAVLAGTGPQASTFGSISAAAPPPPPTVMPVHDGCPSAMLYTSTVLACSGLAAESPAAATRPSKTNRPPFHCDDRLPQRPPPCLRRRISVTPGS